jgi:hypothetical protein
MTHGRTENLATVLDDRGAAFGFCAELEGNDRS